LFNPERYPSAAENKESDSSDDKLTPSRWRKN
jgi:hypothetical protein